MTELQLFNYLVALCFIFVVVLIVVVIWMGAKISKLEADNSPTLEEVRKCQNKK